VSEWQLFEPGTVPFFTTPEFFAAHPWVPPEQQGGHAERTAMVADLIHDIVLAEPFGLSLVDLGCGDGSLLSQIGHLPISTWGYDAGIENVKKARAADLDVYHADLLSDPQRYADISVASEVVEHLVDPHGFLRDLPGRYLVISSPSAETDEWHYLHHAWAWDLDGYVELVRGAGWHILDQVECDGGDNFHGGIRRPQRFQAICATRVGR